MSCPMHGIVHTLPGFTYSKKYGQTVFFIFCVLFLALRAPPNWLGGNQ